MRFDKYPEPLRIVTRMDYFDLPNVGYSIEAGEYWALAGSYTPIDFQPADPACPHRCDEGILYLREPDDTSSGWSDAPHLCPCQQPGYVSPSEDVMGQYYDAMKALASVASFEF